MLGGAGGARVKLDKLGGGGGGACPKRLKTPVLLDILTVINTHYTSYVQILHFVHIYIYIYIHTQ